MFSTLCTLSIFLEDFPKLVIEYCVSMLNAFLMLENGFQHEETMQHGHALLYFKKTLMNTCPKLLAILLTHKQYKYQFSNSERQRGSD